jgi:hypothetical protein
MSVPLCLCLVDVAIAIASAIAIVALSQLLSELVCRPLVIANSLPAATNASVLATAIVVNQFIEGLVLCVNFCPHFGKLLQIFSRILACYRLVNLKKSITA